MAKEDDSTRETEADLEDLIIVIITMVIIIIEMEEDQAEAVEQQR